MRGKGELAHQNQQLFEGPGGERPEILHISPKEETSRFTNKQLLKTTYPDFIRNRKECLVLCQMDILLPRKCHLLDLTRRGITGTREKLRKHNAGKSTFFHIFKLKQQKTTLIVLPATTTLQPFSLHSRIRQTFEVDKSWGGG